MADFTIFCFDLSIRPKSIIEGVAFNVMLFSLFLLSEVTLPDFMLLFPLLHEKNINIKQTAIEMEFFILKQF